MACKLAGSLARSTTVLGWDLSQDPQQVKILVAKLAGLWNLR
jgi:hypothetical protein